MAEYYTPNAAEFQLGAREHFSYLIATMARPANTTAPAFDASALAFASLVGGVLLWVPALVSASEPFASVARLVLLLPLLGLVSGVAASALLLPAWWLARMAGFQTSRSFGLVVFSLASLLCLAFLPFTESSVAEMVQGSVILVLWLSGMAVSYVIVLGRRPNPSVKRTGLRPAHYAKCWSSC